ncbi:MAG: hypothetical protein ABR613_07765 [Actinomycetota bacterium]
MKNLKRGVVAALLAAAALVPAAPASADTLRFESCPEGTRGVVIGVTTSATGEKWVFACVRPISWT